MKLTQLEYFCVAARYHNITKAAKELFVTQPSVSNAIKSLEEEFGVNLFYRHNNKLTLTPEGEKFYKSAEELLAHADAVTSELYEFRKQVTPIRIGIPPKPIREILRPVLPSVVYSILFPPIFSPPRFSFLPSADRGYIQNMPPAYADGT